jgi:lipopolysaccharide/colanic/teichoic acid biosynthesis glycosyltransferase
MRRDADPAVHREFVQWFCDGKVAAVEGKVAPGELTETLFKLKNDSRVTRLGRFLRRTSLDELPQLINVLKGEMTLVGPRPVPPYEMAHYKQTHYERFAAVPGITGLWQVQGRGRVPFEEMIRMDMEYVRNCSLWLDLKILVSTVPVVFRGSGAH